MIGAKSDPIPEVIAAALGHGHNVRSLDDPHLSQADSTGVVVFDLDATREQWTALSSNDGNASTSLLDVPGNHPRLGRRRRQIDSGRVA